MERQGKGSWAKRWGGEASSYKQLLNKEAGAVDYGGMVFEGVRWEQMKGMGWEGKGHEEKKVGWDGLQRRKQQAWLGLNGWKSLWIIIPQLSSVSEIHPVFHAPHVTLHKGGWATFTAYLLHYVGCSGPRVGFVSSDNPQKCHCDASWRNLFTVKETTNSVKRALWRVLMQEVEAGERPITLCMHFCLPDCVLYDSCFSYVTVCCFFHRTPASFTACDRPALR